MEFEFKLAKCINDAFMRKVFLFTMILLSASFLFAEDYNYLILEKLDGSGYALTAKGLTITFDEDNLNAVNGTETAIVRLRELKKMFFSNDKIGYVANELVRVNHVAVEVVGRNIYVQASLGTQVAIYQIDGQLIGKYKTFSSLREAVGPTLFPGIYIVRVDQQSTKIQIR